MLDFPFFQPLQTLDFSLIPNLLAQTSPDLTADQIERYSPLVNGASLVSYLIIAYFSWEIFKKVNVENAWFAWIPILGTYITFVAGDNEKPVLWTVLMCIPCVNLIALFPFIGAWIKICQKIGKSPWLLLLCIFPCINFLVFGYLAFG
ncbi:MAG: hypothetical protein AB4058_05165 [Microcystaceae cyanobacterium]